MALFSEKPVAVVFDWDKTLSPTYQQRPLFEEYRVDEKKFWTLTHTRTRAHQHYLDNRCFVEHEYLNTILDYTRRGIFKGLNNSKLTELGTKLQLYPGVREMFYELKERGVEIYIVSGGIRSMLKGIDFVKDCVTEIYAADFADYELDDHGKKIEKDTIQSIVISVIPTDKTRILNEISKGCAAGNFDTNATLPQERRRIPFKNMIYVGDGVSDIHAFGTVRRDGGHAVAVYNPQEPQFDQAEMLRTNRWVDLLATADYREGATAYDWILMKTLRLQESIKSAEKQERDAELEQVRKYAPSYIHAWGKQE
jgi:2-hydroxy-3-keto-5-methylthiopentenyl-1-phosphate phosphatase